MCGLVAVFARDVRSIDDGRKRAALHVLQHRGPDGRGTYTSDDHDVWLGHARLSIVAPDDGAQPIANEDGSIVAIVNGEFYGDARLRVELEQRGHTFRTRSDSELLVHLYEEHGLACLERLRGEFAFVLWDSRRRRVVAARDRFGVKPLVYSFEGGALRLASEAKALFALGVEATWDDVALEHAFTHQYLPMDRTFFRGVHTLPPGHLVIADRPDLVRVERYWDLDLPVNPSRIDEVSAKDLVRQQLDDAVHLRLRADVPVAFHLSGGLDSASILALARRTSNTRLHAFSVAFEHPPYDEAEAAAEVARALDVEHDVVLVSQDALLDVLPDAVHFSEGLCINGQLPAKLLLARAIRERGYKVALSGEGADEAFLGYAHLGHDLSDDGAGATGASPSDSAQRGVLLPAEDAPDVPEVRRVLGYVPTFLRAKAAFGAQLLALCRDATNEGRTTTFNRLLASLDINGQLSGRAPVLQSAYLWTRLALGGYILRTLGDGTEMAASIEGRPPFLDHVLFEQVRALPIEQKIRRGVQKYVLREAMRELLPEATVVRRKHPFLAPPLTRFGSKRARAVVLDLLSSDCLRRVPLLDRRKVLAFAESCFTDSESAVANAREPVLMTLVSACLMQDRFSLSEAAR